MTLRALLIELPTRGGIDPEDDPDIIELASTNSAV